MSDRRDKITEELEKELLPCPFCGKQAFIHESIHEGKFYYAIGCATLDCPGDGWTSGKPGLWKQIKLWNTRTTAENKQ